MNHEWVTWAFQILLGLLLTRVWLAIDKNTDSISSLREEIPKTYATKLEVDRHHSDDKDNFRLVEDEVHSLRNKLHGVELIMAAEKGSS